MKEQADKHRSEAIYKEGQMVWLSTAHLNLCTTWQSLKLTERWLGPCKIKKVINNNTMELLHPWSMKIHPVMNVSHIKPYKEQLLGQQANKPGAMVVTDKDDKEYEVDYIIDSHLKCGKLEFLVHWKGYTDEDCMWEPESNLTRSHDGINDFYLLKPNAP